MKEQNMESNSWLIHVSKEFLPLWQQRLTDEVGSAIAVKKIASDFYQLHTPSMVTPSFLQQTIFPRFILPIQYMWPTKVAQKGMIEKCAQGIASKFQDQTFTNVVVFSVERKNQTLASNVRGRLLQVLDTKLELSAKKEQRLLWTKDPTTQDPKQKNLIVAISEKCIWAGILSPQLSGSFFAGGRRYVGIGNEDTASRAAAKFVESAEVFRLNGYKLPERKNYLELGAAPGGITSELVLRKNNVWAVDKAAIDSKLLANPLVHFVQKDAREYKANVFFDALISDLNGPAPIAADICRQHSAQLNAHGYLLFTYKIHAVELFNEEFQKILASFKQANCKFLFGKHLYNNKQEITLFFQKA